METTDYCSYELSKALKACGFDEPCDHYWSKAYKNSDRMAIRQASADDYNNDDWDVPHCSAPHIYHAQKWLREKHHISIRVSYISYHKVWFADWLNLESGEFDDTYATFDSYEDALADGISAALELIKKGE